MRYPRYVRFSLDSDRRLDIAGRLERAKPGSSSRFGPSEVVNTWTPVVLPPGRLKLLTSPSWTGSLPLTKTIGIVGVAACPPVPAGARRS